MPSILATIRAHYWETPGPDALKQAYAGDLSPQKLHTLRSGLLEVVKVIMKASAAQDNIAEDVQVCSACPLVVTSAECHACARQTLLQHSTVCLFAVTGITRQQLAALQLHGTVVAPPSMVTLLWMCQQCMDWSCSVCNTAAPAAGAGFFHRGLPGHRAVTGRTGAHLQLVAAS